MQLRKKFIFISLFITLALSFNSSFCIKNDDEEQTNCLICLQPAGNDQTIEVPCCKAWFHVECIKQWHKINPACPNCRENIPSKIGNVTLSKNKKNNLKKNNALDNRLYAIRLHIEELAPFSRHISLKLAEILTNLLINRITPLYQRHPQHPEFATILPILQQMRNNVTLRRQQQQQILHDIARERHRQELFRVLSQQLTQLEHQRRRQRTSERQQPKPTGGKINNFLEDAVVKTVLFSASTYLISSLVSKIFLATVSTSMPMLTFIWTIPLAWRICRNKGLARAGKRFIRLPAKIVGLA